MMAPFCGDKLSSVRDLSPQSDRCEALGADQTLSGE